VAARRLTTWRHAVAFLPSRRRVDGSWPARGLHRVKGSDAVDGVNLSVVSIHALELS
jgi:hypothetical protein